MNKGTIQVYLKVFSIIILYILILSLLIPINSMDIVQTNAVNEIDPNASADYSYEQNYSQNMFGCSSRSSRYLEENIHLNDYNIQLSIYSGNDEDNADNNGEYHSGGSLVTTGDIDNDGFDDLILGSPFANGADENAETAGQVMVVFGGNQTHPGTAYDQADQNSAEIGLVIHGADGDSLFNTGDSLGTSVACGDIDGDGYDDLIIGAPYGDSSNNQRRNAGEVYVLYGASRSLLGTEINFESVTPDFMILGVDADFINSDLSGYSVAVGDVIGDSKKDIIIGAPGANGGGNTDSGTVYVISGKPRTTQGSSLDLATGADLVISGWDVNGLAGFEVTAGDVNGDSREDILIGAPYAELDDLRTNGGVTYIVYGRNSFSSDISLRSGANVVIQGSDAYDYLGWSLAVGNINGDSYNDIIIGAPFGNGPNNAQTDCGEAYIIYGSATINSAIDLKNNEQDVVIYGKDDYDELGFSVAMGSIDSDLYDDLLVSARRADGQYNAMSQCGEVYLIRGNSSAKLGSNIDPITDARSIIYGANNSDESGRTVRFGDFDADGVDDIIIAAPLSYGQKNRKNCGGYYLIFGQSPPMINLGLRLLDGDIDDVTILARYRPYIFQLNVTNILGYRDFDSVTFTIDPIGYNIIYRWSRSENKFMKIRDPDGHVECLSVQSDAVHDSLYTYSINFKMFFNWSFKKTYPIDCMISSVGKNSLLSKNIYPNIFKVKNKLNFAGDLQAAGSIQGKLDHDSWVAGAEELSFTGITPVYDGTFNYYPPINEYSIVIEDNFNSTVITNPSLGESIKSKLVTPQITVDNHYNIKFIKIPDYSDNSSVTITLKIDNDPPKPPGFIFVKADSSTELGAAVVDDDTEIYLSWDMVQDVGSGTAGYYYSFKDNSGTSAGFWTTETSAILTNGTEGKNQVYVWSIDNVGNIGTSSWSEIFIDLTEVTFSNFTPNSNDWFNSKLINCSIQVSDLAGFGVDNKELWYWDIQFNKWTKVPDFESSGLNGSRFTLSVKAQLNEGMDSFIQFRAQDIAGNGPTDSEKFYFKIDTTPVEFVNTLPNPDKKHADTRVRCKVTVQDLGGSGVNLSTIQFSYSTSGLEGFSNWSDSGLAMLGVAQNAEQASNWFVDLVFKRTGENYIKWRARDLAHNGWAVSKPLLININSLPIIIVEELPKDTKLYGNKELELNGERTYDNDDQVSKLNFTWSSNITGVLGHDRVFTTKLPAGNHQITLKVFDGLNNATYKFNITVFKPDSAKNKLGLFGLGEMFDYILIILIIILIILSLFFVLYSRERKKRKDLEEQERLRSMGPDISYIPTSPRSPLFAGGADSGATVGLSSQLGAGSRPGPGFYAPQLPGTAQAQTKAQTTPFPQLPMPTNRPLSTTAQTSNVGTIPGSPSAGTINRKVPQLPPATAHVGVSIPGTPKTSAPVPGLGLEFELLKLDPSQKLELLEQKMLLGQIPIELYTKLTEKFESELKATTPKVHIPEQPDDALLGTIPKTTQTPLPQPQIKPVVERDEIK